MKPRHPNLDWIRKVLAELEPSSGTPPPMALALCHMVDEPRLTTQAADNRDSAAKPGKVAES